ncbi:unnamed protein product [Cylicostephanus goldi]|uniref:Branched-chain-amino-acid aminotransferase n=1 Tax=Cylicostephanus goldi TaxID=71465 RepID=A0A3P6T2B2_CYLGO|nr:unnamed protein product [Cylicostephanus goldi]
MLLVSKQISFQVLHYACELFEGLKAYRGADNRIRMFRPELNMARMRRFFDLYCSFYRWCFQLPPLNYVVNTKDDLREVTDELMCKDRDYRAFDIRSAPLLIAALFR